MKLKIKDTEYEIISIRPETPKIMRIEFPGEIMPDEWGEITTYTKGGMEAGHVTGYDTVYKTEGRTVYLSNDGSIYHEPEPVIPPEPYIPTPEELLLEAQATKKREVSEACERMIYTGVSVTLGDGTVEHYSLTEHDQLNLFGKQAQLAAGAESLEYHADGQPCRYYSAADMQSIIQAAMWHVSYHTTYCNALNMWIANCQTADDVWLIFYGADIPEKYRNEVLNAYLLQIEAMAEENSNENSERETVT
ncbi:MAG TPA: acyl carrier protein [Lachnospiraceae bacterium]|nr:acyl carrier protein [Lachnospiraceae bacterium]